MDPTTLIILLTALVAYLIAGFFFLQKIGEDPVAHIVTGSEWLGFFFWFAWPAILLLYMLLVLRPDVSDGKKKIRKEDETPRPTPIGSEGVTITPLRPWGKVQIAERLVEAPAEMGFLPAGVRVRVIGTAGKGVTVREADGVQE